MVKILIVLTWTILSLSINTVASESDSADVSIPGPEEIEEAFSDGVITYEEYLMLLEISGQETAGHEDTLILMQYGDIITRMSSSVLTLSDEDAINKDEEILRESKPRWRQSCLYRQNQKLRDDDDLQRTLRFRSDYRETSLYGDYSTLSDGRGKWGRRYIESSRNITSTATLTLILGNYRKQFGQGAVYGYHGQLISKTDTYDNMEGFLFPRYGGSNGVACQIENPTYNISIVYDTDRNDELKKDFIGAAWSIKAGRYKTGLVAALGRLRNRINSSLTAPAYVSFWGNISRKHARGNWEGAVAFHDGRKDIALAGDFRWKTKTTSLAVEGWHYGNAYPGFFAGGISSRRYRTIEIDNTGITCRDRFRGETGAVVRTQYKISRRSVVHTGVAYAWRNILDSRVEVQATYEQKLGQDYRGKIRCYWENDALYSRDGWDRRWQIEAIRNRGIHRTRLAIGYRYDLTSNRDDYMLFIEHRIKERFGRLVAQVKCDRLRLRQLRNEQTYLSLSHESAPVQGMGISATYTYRYRRSNPQSSYGMLRWDISWIM